MWGVLMLLLLLLLLLLASFALVSMGSEAVEISPARGPGKA